MLFKSQKLLTPLAAISALLIGSAATAAIPASYTQDFEGMAVADLGTDLSADGWLVGANVFDAPEATGGVFKFFYGLFGAPNGGPGFSSVATGDTVPSGANYLNVYSDYNCCGLGGGTPEGHGNATDEVHALVLREYTIEASDIGKTLTFTFDAKRPDFVDDGGGFDQGPAVANDYCLPTPCSSTAGAFIKTLDPSMGFNTTNLVQEDMTAIDQASWTSFSMMLAVTDPLLVGQILQVGFENRAVNFNTTGVYYDNISITTTGGPATVFVPVPAMALLGLAGLLAAAGAYVRRLR